MWVEKWLVKNYYRHVFSLLEIVCEMEEYKCLNLSFIIPEIIYVLTLKYSL